jgi:2-hydroxychromene-2-carboxylate isomerase
MAQLDFWFSYGSTYTYLSVMRIEMLAAEQEVEIVWRPFSLGTILQELGYQQGPFRANPSKLAYMWRDLERRATYRGLDYNRPPDYPIERPELLATRVGLMAAVEGWCAEYSKALYRANFVDGKTLGLKENVNGALVSIERDPETVIAAARRDEVENDLERANEEAKAFGIFGSPSFVTDGELFWGDDRLEDAINWCTGRLTL